MRWYALNVDYEMSGKDLIDSVKLSSRICNILGGTPPANLTYELFLDDQGQKISKSKGNGLAVDDWLKYAPPESLSLYMFQKPKTAKRLFFDVIPKAVDEYLDFLGKFPGEQDPARLDNPIWHIHGGQPPHEASPLTFGLLLNLAGVCHAETPDVVWAYVARYAPGASPASAPLLDKLVNYAVAYYRDFVKPTKAYKKPSPDEVKALTELREALAGHTGAADADALQTIVFEIGKRHPATFASLRDWFKALYQILLGQDQGPRMGSFIALYGVKDTMALIDKAVAGEVMA
jgi:lysyl-tRNA synthetase class 1